MSDLIAVVSQPAQSYTRKKDGQPGLILKATLEDNTAITLYGKDGDTLLSERREGELIKVSKNGNFYSIIALMNEEGEFVAVEKQYNQNSQQTPINVNHDISQIDTEEIKRYIRWHAKILDYCYEQNANKGDLLYQQACKKFNL